MEYKGRKIIITQSVIWVVDKDERWYSFPTEAEAREWIDEEEREGA